MSKTIQSDTPKTLDWYKKEIFKAYSDIKHYKARYYEALKNYNKHMTITFNKAYQLTKKDSLKDKVRLTREYKADYKELSDMFLKCGDLYSKYLLSLDILEQLKKERAQVYAKLREQSNQNNSSN